jgi:hypothetical protein
MRALPLLALTGWLVAGCAAPSPAALPGPVSPPAASPAPEAAPEPAPPASPEVPEPATCAELRPEPLPRSKATLDPALVAIEDEHGALGAFYEKLAALLRGDRQEPLRVAVYGDSNITADWFTGGLRRTLQGRLGDGGHGFVAVGRPWPGYVHMDVKHGLSPVGWAVHAVSTKPSLDHRYGFAGIEVQSTGSGARAWVETAGPSSPVGRAASRIGVHFLRGPGLGAFEVRVDGQRQGLVETEAPTFGAGHALFEVPDGHHQVLVEARTAHQVRLFGTTLERSGPGLVIDSLGVAASTTATIMRQERTVFLQSLRDRNYDLVILTHGAFDVVSWNTEEQHSAAVASMIALHREALPGASILMVSPVDYRGPLDDTRANPAHASREKRALARAHQVAFWDQRSAMGGDRSIALFLAHHMADPDRIHLNQKGGLFMGNRLALALWGALASYLETHPRAGCPG